MIQRLTAWFPLLLLAASPRSPSGSTATCSAGGRSATGKARHDPDYIAENFTMTRIGPDGAVRYRMRRGAWCTIRTTTRPSSTRRAL